MVKYFVMLCLLFCLFSGCAGAHAGIAKVEPPNVATIELEHEGTTYVAMAPDAWAEVQSYFVATDKQYATTVETLVEIVGAVAPVVTASANLAAVIGRVSDAEVAKPPEVAMNSGQTECESASVGTAAGRPEH